jgi:hypothetical protein
MRGHLNELEDKIFSKWTAQVPEQCVKNLEKPLMIQAEETLELSLNFDNKVVFIVQYMTDLRIFFKYLLCRVFIVKPLFSGDRHSM